LKKIKLLFGIHNHQPVGNFDHVFEQTFQKCYKPYYEVLRVHKNVKTAVHFSGPLLEWLKANHPDYLKMLRDMVAEGRLEILSGGFYEPLLPSLPDEDAIGQIKMMNEFIQHEFGAVPRGLWLAERIWMPNIPQIIADADIQYTIIDDTHFYYSGLEEKQMNGYYITEKHGKPLFIFPISKTLRYAIPFKQPEETLAHLRRMKEEHNFDVVTYGDDGEKFGGWPETYQWVYNETWLHRFFTAIEDSRDWLETATFSEYIDHHPPTGRIYLPMASYDEMMEWSLPTRTAWKFADLKQELKNRGLPEESYKVFLRGGQWDNFLTKYDESNNLHKKMLYVSKKVKKLPKELQKSSHALQELYRGQCNCAQWHGLFGGLYLNYLRHALYNHLIAAENLVDEASKKSAKQTVDIIDFNMDGRDEVLFSNKNMNAYFAPASGGGLFELDYRPICFNLSNVLRRREETYHKTIREASQNTKAAGNQPQSIHDRVHFKEEGLQNMLFYDKYERYSFLDHFLGEQTTLEKFKQSAHVENGEFIGHPYEMEKSAKVKADQPFTLKLKRSGVVKEDDLCHPVTIRKSFTLSPDQAEIIAHYQITNDGQEELNGWFGVEFNFTMLAGDAEDRYYYSPDQTIVSPRLRSEGELNDVHTFGMRDDWFRFQLEMSFEPSATVWRHPIESISQSEDGFERTYQGSCLLANWALCLGGGKSVEYSIRVNITPTAKK
jgi:alpha-amylase